MPTNTTYLNMSLYNSTTDGSATFASWRAAIDGVSPTSNFNVLDTYAQNTSASITALQVKSFYLVPAVYVSPNYYEANSLTSITAYTTGMYLDIYLDTTNVGSVTLNINALGTKTLKKVDATGALVDLDSNDLEKNKEYLFRYNGTYFVWVAVSSGASTAYSGSALITISGSKISHTVSGVSPGTYTSANLTVDDYGHLTAVSNGTSASSTGAPSDTPFLVSGSVSVGVTNAKQLVGGSCIVLTESGSTIIVASDCIPLSEISGSGVMSDTTGSIVKHNYSGVVAGSANKIQFDNFGHIVSASVIPVPQTATLTAGQALQTYDSTTGVFEKVSIPLSATGVSGKALYSYDASTGSFVSINILNAITGSSVMSDTTGSVIKHNHSGVISGSYNKFQVDNFGHITSASIVSTGAEYSGSALIIVSGSKISHETSVATEGSYLSANVTIDGYGHITNISNGISASSVGASADNPFYVSGSITGLANAKFLDFGENINKETAGSVVTISSASTIYSGATPILVSGSSIAHDNSGVGSGTYNRVEVNDKGHVISASNVGYQTVSSIAGSGIMSDSSGSIVKHNVSGVISGSYNKFEVDDFGHIISASIIATGNEYSGILPISITGSEISHNVSGVVSGSYNKIEVDEYGHIISASVVIAPGETSITGSGVMSDSSGSIVKHNVSGISSGSYTKIEIDSYGHVISGSVLDVYSISGSPVNNSSVSGNTVSLEAYEAQEFGDVCYIANNGRAKIGSASVIETATCIALCADNSVSASSIGTYLLTGVARKDSWSWTAGNILYLSASGVSGSTITHTAPSETDNVIQILGVAIDSNRIFFNPQLAQVEHT